MNALVNDLETRARTLRTFPPMRLDRDGLEQFFSRATALVPGGGALVGSVDVRDDDRAASFREIDALFRAPHLPASLDDVEMSLVRTAAGTVTHEIRLEAIDGRATLSALGDELWAYGAVAALSDILDVYAIKTVAVRPPSLVPLNFYSGGFVFATSFAIGMARGTTRGAATLAILAIVWFLLDMGLCEVRSALTPAAAPAFVLELRARAQPKRRAIEPGRLWAFARFGTIALWFAASALIFALVLRHVPVRW